MVSSDTVVGIVGAVILTGAMIAVFYYENSNANADDPNVIGEGANTYTFEYQQTNDTTATLSGTPRTLTAGQSDTLTFDLPAYVYDVQVVVTWTEDSDQATGPLGSGPDEFTVELYNNSDQQNPTDANTDRSGSIQVGHGHADGNDTTPPQNPVTVRGDSEAAAEMNLVNQTSGAHGVGEWQVTVTLNDTGTAQTAPNTDTGNTYSISVTYSYWAPVLQP